MERVTLDPDVIDWKKIGFQGVAGKDENTHVPTFEFR